MGLLRDFIFDNAYAQDAEEVEKEVREKYPLLLHEKEKIVLAFCDRGGKGRDKEFFTSHRIVIKDGKGVGNKRKNYKSIPYDSIQAYAVETAGPLDGDCELEVWSRGIRHVKLDFSEVSCDIFQIQQFINGMVAEARNSKEGTQDEIDATPPNMDKKQTSAGNMIDWFGDNAKQVDAAEVENTFKTSMPVLLKNEQVEIAFKSGRDYTVFTDRRFMRVNVKGLTGKRIQFLTVAWDSIHSFSVQTAGSFLDRDMEMKLFTNILGLDSIDQDFRHGKSDIFAVQKALCNHVLGDDTDPLDDVDKHEGEVDQKGFWWFRDNQRPLDATEMDLQYHSNPAILRGNEHVELAFKGWRDVTIFTNLRILLIDPKGVTGKRVEYLTIPWTSVVGHGVRSAGKYVDFDAEVCIWTQKEFTPGRAGGEKNPPVPPAPYMSFFELDFNKSKVDMNALNYYLSRRIVALNKMEPGAPIPIESMTNEIARPGGVERLWQWLGGDQRELNPNDLNQELHTNTQVLLDDEKVLMAFKAGRDTALFTNLRVLTMDVQGLSGQKVEYQSIPYKNIKAWSVQTAGMWDRDLELSLYTRNRWDMARIDMDFRTGKADIAQINSFLSALIIGIPTDAKVDFGPKDYSSGNQEASPIEAGSMGMLDNSWEIDAAMIDNKLRSDPPLLLEEEKVLKAFQSGRDVDVYTTRRMIQIDTKGLTGKRVMYKSIPFKNIHGFEFETAGHMDRDAEMYLCTDIAHVKKERFPRVVPCLKTKQSLLVKDIDIYEIGKLFTDHLLFAEEKYAAEPEIDVTLY